MLGHRHLHKVHGALCHLRLLEVSLVVWLGIGQPALEATFPILPLWKFLFWRRGLKQVWLSNHFWCLYESILRFFSKLCLQRLGHFCNSRGACTRTVEASSCTKEASSMASTQMPLSGMKSVGHPFCSGMKSLLQNSFTCYVSANAGNDCWSHGLQNVCVYIYVCVWRESKFIYLQTAIAKKQIPSHTFANLSHTPANPTFIFRGVASIHFCAVETHSNSMQTATVWAIRETASYICKAMLGKFNKIPPGNSRVSLFTTFAWLAAAKVPSGLLASMDILIATVFAKLSRNFRKKTFCTSTNKSTPWIVVRGSAPLDYSIVLGSIPRLPISQSNSG